MIVRLLAALLLIMPSLLQAVTIDELHNSGQLAVSYTIVDKDAITQYQPVMMEIEVSTDRWFASGSRVERFDIQDAIVYRSSQTSTNSSRTVAGTTRALQLWTLVFYPQKSGALTIPKLRLFVSLNTEGNNIVEGYLTLDSQTITVNTPAAMNGVDHWLAANNLTINERYDGLKDSYKPGDAITRTISLRIEGSPAMMLPAIEFPEQKGLALYQVPPKVSESSNRGQLIGTRVEQFIITIEAEGSYQLPGYQYYWWNLQSQQQKLLALEPLAFATDGAGTASVITEPGPLLKDYPGS
ncbi:BatD family protein [Oceanicoccus sagamiensis]|uniref:Protein BatD n=1 Tax=Oceanicoccus sagamiensis TaxID=716816 RepID=A0A1X9NCK1_9GAMM|nr:BatD family protein [Oceanicoccus sagamiensis]ARN75758.1 hypothetical protein BST96_17580 [Oceanicoccus sagamiensis]